MHGWGNPLFHPILPFFGPFLAASCQQTTLSPSSCPLGGWAVFDHLTRRWASFHSALIALMNWEMPSASHQVLRVQQQWNKATHPWVCNAGGWFHGCGQRVGVENQQQTWKKTPTPPGQLFPYDFDSQKSEIVKQMLLPGATNDLNSFSLYEAIWNTLAGNFALKLPYKGNPLKNWNPPNSMFRWNFTGGFWIPLCPTYAKF